MGRSIRAGEASSYSFCEVATKCSIATHPGQKPIFRHSMSNWYGHTMLNNPIKANCCGAPVSLMLPILAPLPIHRQFICNRLYFPFHSVTAVLYLRSCILCWHFQVNAVIYTNVDVYGGPNEDCQCGRHRADHQAEAEG